MAAVSAELIAHVARLGDALGEAVRPSTLLEQLRVTTASVRALFGAAACSCALVEADGGAVRFAAASGAGADAIVGTVLPVDRGIAGWVAMSGQPIAIADVAADPRFARDVAAETRFVPTSIMAAPLVTGEGEVLGVIEVLDRSAGSDHTGRDLEVLGVLAAQLASVVELSAVYDGLGSVLLTAATGAADQAELAQRLQGAAESGSGVGELAALAVMFQRLAALGPRGRQLAATVLQASLGFVEEAG